MSAGPLSSRVASLCDDVGPRVGAATGAEVYRVRRRLDEPLRVAIAGRLKAGKSTLVNALIGRRVAPTQVGECTRIVTQFRYGTADRVDVVRRDGSRASLPLDPAGMIPQRLGVPRAQIAFVDVTLTSDHLRQLTVIDTPGLSSASAGVSESAQRFLFAADPGGAGGTAATGGGADGSDRGDPDTTAPFDAGIDDDSVGAVSGAEAIVYVFTQSVRDDDVRALEAFRSASARLSSNPINSVGLFNKVDKLVAGGTDPWPVAGPLATDQTRVLRRVVSDVVPVVGLLAETTEAGRLTAADCEALRALAAMAPAQRTVLMASVDLFVDRDCPVPRRQRQRLLALLDLYGVGFAVAQLQAAPQLASGDLVRALYAASGFPRLRHTLDETFQWRTDAIKAGWALSSLEKVASRTAHPGDRETLRDAIERLLHQPEYHRLRLLEVAAQVSTGSVELPEAMEQELTRLALSTDPRWVLDLPQAPVEQLAAAAVAAATRWRVFAVAGASPAQSRVALVAHRGFHLLSQQVRAGGGR
ncbi:dynamin family protein [Solwaraspora sp. WMMB335]|uniref:dynamin family protein n=1 Tax=Solwaraspora sp. WMMB335 TaxID=3404118 RepID=UPI003B938F58